MRASATTSAAARRIPLRCCLNRSRHGIPPPVEPHPISAHRLGNVLDLLLAGKIERQAQFAAQLIVGRAGEQHAARIAELLQPRGDVDSVAEQIVAFHHHVAEIDADAEDDAALGRNFGLRRRDLLLQRHGTRYRVHHRAELDDGAVAHQLDDAALVLGQQRVDDFGAKLAYRGQGAGLVTFDEPRITNDIGGQNRRQAPFGRCRFHGTLPRRE